MALTDNLVSYWKLDESSGNATDSVGGDTGVNTSVTYAAGKINNGGVFDRTVPSKLAITGPGSTAQGSLCMWINGTYATDNADYGVFSTPAWSSTGNVFIYIRRRDGEGKSARMGFDVFGSSAESYATSDLTASAFNHCVWTWNTTSKEVQFYINATLSGTSTLATLPTPVFTTVNIGGGILTGRNYTGTLDEIAFYNRVITSTEVSQLYNGGAGLQYPFFTPSPMMHMMQMAGGIV